MALQKEVQHRPELDDESYRMVQQLFQVVRSGDSEQVERLLHMGLVPNLRDEKGNSLLMLAAYHGQADLVRVLLSFGADPELVNDRGQTPLQAVAFKGDVETGRALLSGGAEVNGCGEDGKTPLMYAAMFARMPMIDWLIEQGADPGIQSRERMTAALLARMMGADEAAERLAR